MQILGYKETKICILGRKIIQRLEANANMDIFPGIKKLKSEEKMERNVKEDLKEYIKKQDICQSYF